MDDKISKGRASRYADIMKRAMIAFVACAG